MSSPTIGFDRLYEFTLQQMAAESYLEDGGIWNDQDQIIKRLTLGTNRDNYQDGDIDLNQGWPGFTRMTSSQAAEFWDKFEIIHQWSDDPSPTGERPKVDAINTAGALLNGPEMLANTGFSATLIRDKRTGEFTISIRSTESREWARGGDRERDMVATDAFGVVGVGFALAQLNALEKYYQWLKDNGILPCGAKLNVTGYSLGGHLATIFTEMHQDDTYLSEFGETVTFNGAGRGSWDSSQGSLNDVMDYYNNVLINPGNGQVDDSVLLSKFASAVLGRQFLPVALITLTLGGLRDRAIALAGAPQDPLSIYNDPRYWWAIACAKFKFNLMPQLPGTGQGTLADAQITQVYGYEAINNINMTANGQNNGPELAVGIESQPLVDGFFGGFLGQGDYGFAHSIDLIADSLALQRAIFKLDSSFSVGKFVSMFPSISSMDTTNFVNTEYEADALENVLDSLRFAILGPKIKKTPFKGGAGGFGDWDSRNTYHDNLKQLMESSGFQTLLAPTDGAPPKVTIELSSNDLGRYARTDFAAYIALLKLSPVVLRPTEGNVQIVNDALKSIWELTYSNWDNDRELSEGEGYESVTDTWIQSRAAMLSWMMVGNRENASAGLFGITSIEDLRLGKDAWHYEDEESSKRIYTIPPFSTNTHLVYFGSKDTDSKIMGADINDDYLFGGSGDDVLKGMAGNDYLEGDEGNDTLEGGEGKDQLVGLVGDDILNGGKGDDVIEGGSGKDTYIFAKGDGSDTIQDSDGLGVILIDGVDLTGGKKIGWDTWLSEDKKFRYVLRDGAMMVQALGGDARDHIYIKDFSSGELGIKLEEPPEELPYNGVIVGDIEPVLVTKTRDDGSTYETYDRDDFGNIKGVAGSQSRSDELFGSVGEDEMHGGAENDSIYGNTGNDKVFGDAGADLLAGGLGEDKLYGGDGNDIVHGDNGYLAPEASTNVRQPSAVAPFEGATFLDSGIGWIRYTASYSAASGQSSAYSNAISSVLYQLSSERFGSVQLTSSYMQPLRQQYGNDDYIEAGQGDDVAYGEGGNDNIFGESGKDTLFGDAGNDYIDGGTEDDLIFGDGLLYAQFYFDSNSFLGRYTLTEPVETYENEFGNDILAGGSGDDYIFGMAGSDIIFGDEGNDYLVGDFFEIVNIPVLTPSADGTGFVQDTTEHFKEAVQFHGNDFIDGGEGDDYIVGLAGDDSLFGQAGQDILLGDGNANEVRGYYGNDYLNGGGDDDFLQGSGGNDDLFGGAGNDKLWGDEYAGSNGSPLSSWGNAPVNQGDGTSDSLAQDRHGHDHLYGEDGNDELVGGGFDDYLDGGAGNDTLYGDGEGVTNEGADTLVGGEGDDQLQGQGGADTLDGGTGVDSLFGGDGNDVLLGGSDNDYLSGGKDDDQLYGDAGDDSLDGGEGNDTLVGGEGRDYLRGGQGDDVYKLTAGDSQIINNTYEVIDDAGGVNKIVFQGGTALTVHLYGTSDLIIKYSDSDGVYVKGGMNGSIASYEFQDGTVKSYVDIVADNLLDNVTRDSYESNVSIVTGVGADTVSIGTNSVITTGKGNDSISASGGSNVINYRIDDGVDTLSFINMPASSPTSNTVRFGEGISLSDLKLYLTYVYYADALEIRIDDDPANAIRLTQFNRDSVASYTGVSLFEFSDGSSISFADLVSKGFIFPATNNADVLTGTNIPDLLDGLDGNDTIYGRDGADFIRGGAGNDTLMGEAGGDTYLYQLGDGYDVINDYDASSSAIDVIQFGDGIAATDVSIVRDSTSMALVIKGTEGVIRLEGQVGIAGQKIEKIIFKDGTTWTAEDLLARSTVGLLPVFGSSNADTISGTDSADYLLGLDGGDTLNGMAGADLLDGGIGFDTIRGGAGDDTLIGGAGYDSLYGDDNNDILFGGADSDRLDGGLGNDKLYGGDDRDDLYGGDGDDELHGGGNDYSYIDSNGNLVVNTSSDYERLDGGAGNDLIYGEEGKDVLVGGTGIDHLYGGAGNDSLNGGGQAVDGSTDVMEGGEGNDSYYIYEAGDQVIEQANQGVDNVTYYLGGSWSLPDNVENASVYIGNSGIQLIGNLLDNEFRGGETKIEQRSDATLGKDIFTGGAGDDTYYLSYNDVAVEAANGGFDTVYTSAQSYTLGSDIESAITERYQAGTSQYSFYRYLTGNDLDNTLRAGTSEDTSLSGGAGNDVLIGLRGSDSLDGGAGNNELVGGGGNDNFYASGTTDKLVVGDGSSNIYLNSGTANIKLGVSSIARINAGSGQYSIAFMEMSLADIHVIASSNTLTISYSRSSYHGSTSVATASLDKLGVITTLDGTMTGADWFAWLHDHPANYTSNVMIGSTGTENVAGGRYTVEHSGTNLWIGSVDAAGSSYGYFSLNNLTPADVGYTIDADGRVHCSSVGSGIATVLIGDISLHAGMDSPDDFSTLDQAGIRDWYVGGGGQDVYGFGTTSGRDVIDSVQPDGVSDVVNIAGPVTPSMVVLSRDEDDLVLTLDQNNSLTLRKYFSDSAFPPVISFSDGTNWDSAAVIFSLYHATQGNDVVTGTGQDDHLFGLGGDDTLNGGAGFDTLDGGSGNDYLDGGSEADTMIGGSGDDVYVVDSTADVVVEQANSGADSVVSTVSLALGSEIENLTLTGAAAINGTGNALANILRGNTKANVLAGGAGNDTYYVGIGDSVTESANAGLDTVVADVNWTLSSNVEDLRLLGSALAGTGNALANHLWGNDLDNTLDGRAGSDVLEGGIGNDLYLVDVAGDVVVEELNGGVDTVQTAISWTLAANIENLTLTGSAKVNGTGNDLDNRIVGTSGTNVLSGGKGNDTYVVTSGDTVTELANEGVDTVESAVAWTLGANIENLTLTGSGKVTGTGNALANILTGNSAANALKGGLGNDTYVVGTGDTVTENTGEGVDTVISSITWTLGANLENLTLSGTSSINGTGNALSNVMRGNSAGNTLTGGTGNDTYQFGRTGGADIIVDSDSTVGNADLLSLDAGIAYDQLWFKHVGTSLEVSVIGTADKVTVNNWYNGSSNHVERLQTADGHYLLDSNVELLVQAMAGMSSPAAGQTTLTTAQHQQLDSVLAASWQAA